MRFPYVIASARRPKRCPKMSHNTQKGTKLVMNNASWKVQTLEGVAREMYSLLLLVSAFTIVDHNPLLT